MSEREHLHLRGVAHAGGATVYLAGELDVAYADEVVAALVTLRGPVVTVDLSEVGFIDASGLSAFLVARRRLAARGVELRLESASPRVRRVFELTGLGGLLAGR